MGNFVSSQLPKDESPKFEASCKKYLVSPLDFKVEVELEPIAVVGDEPLQIQRHLKSVILNYVPTATVRKYEAGSVSHWTVDFESDLASGVFLKP